MKTIIKTLSLCSLAALLAACGSSNTESPALKNPPQAMRSAAATVSDESYQATVQSLYVGFLGRPADPMGLLFWMTEFRKKGLPGTLPELLAGYSSNADIKNIVDSFANGAESTGLYVANNASFINAVYLNLFNRDAEAGGRQFWSGFLDRGEISRGQAVLWIIGGGQHDDAVVAIKKIQAATTLTSLLNTEQTILNYRGDQMNEAARALLGTITATTDMDVFRTDINTFIASLGSSDVLFPAVSRYVGYHYLQDMSNAPVYAASYNYSLGGIAGQANTGKLTYGVVPQTVTSSRDPVTRVLTFASPVVASVNLPSTELPPTLTMLCSAVPGANGSVTKSTDVLVSRYASQLLDASQLAGQTLSVYREDCATGGSHVQSFVFDAAGNGTFTSASGTLTFDAKSVTAALNGQVLVDISTGKYLVFSAYRYNRNDRSVAYAIVQHLGNHLTGVNDGVIAVWAQE